MRKRGASNRAFLFWQKWIPNSYASVQSPVLEVFRENFFQPIMLSVGPKMGVVPGKPKRYRSQQSGMHNCRVWVKDRELRHEFLHFLTRTIERQ